MKRIDCRVFAVAAALLSACLASAQAPATQTAGTAGPLPAAETPNGARPANVQTIPLPQPTPESVGDSLMAHRRYQAAIQAYKQAPQDSAAVWNKMGIAYQMMFNVPDATRCYQKSLRLDPKNVNVLNNLGTVYDSEKNYREAVRMYQKALKIDSKSPLVLKNMGTDLLAQHKYKKGWETYQRALAIDPQIFDNNSGPRVENPASVQERGAMNYYMAKGCVRAGKNDEAIQYLRKAMDEGFVTPRKIAADVEFAGLHGLPAFDRLVAQQNRQ